MINAKPHKHPLGLYVATGAEVWERLSFFLVQSVLILFLVDKLHFSDARGYSLYTAISGLIYATPVIGGVLADKVLNFKRAIIFGIVLYIVGYFFLISKSPSMIYLAFALQIVANGFVKGNITSLLGQQYKQGSLLRDSGFTWLYFGINIGQTVGPLLASFVIYRYNFQAAFLISAISSILSLLTFCVGRKYLRRDESSAQQYNQIACYAIYVLAILAVVVIAFMLRYPAVINITIIMVSLFSLLYLLAVSLKLTDKHARNKMLGILIIFVFSVLYWGLFLQTFTSLLLFARRNSADILFHVNISPPFLVAIQGAAIVVIAPFLSKLWERLGDGRWQPSYGLKFSYGFFFVMLAYLTLVVAIDFFSAHAHVNVAWLILCFIFLAVSELCFSAIGLSAISFFAPKKYLGLVMGFWFLTISAGMVLASKLASLAVIKYKTETAYQTLPIYYHAYHDLWLLSVIVLVISLCFVPILKKCYI